MYRAVCALARVCLSVRACACVRACVRVCVCVRACVRACTRVCAKGPGGGGGGGKGGQEEPCDLGLPERSSDISGSLFPQGVLQDKSGNRFTLRESPVAP